MFTGQFIQEVCELLDITVLHDMEPLSDREEDYSFRSVVALGWNAEPDAGVNYGVVSPWFSTEEELDAFCQRNIERFRQAAEACNNGAPVPDATEWEESMIQKLIRSEEGQDIAEYAVMLAVILAIVVGVLHMIGSAAGNTINSAASQISGGN